MVAAIVLGMSAWLQGSTSGAQEAASGAGLSAWSLLSGLIGALLVFCLGVARELWRDERERRGVLRIILAEMEHNFEVEATVRRSRSAMIGPGHVVLMHTDGWRDTRVKAALLLPPKLLSGIEAYYSALETMLTLRPLYEAGSEYAKQASPRGRAPWGHYAQKAINARYRAQQGIEAYLSRTWLSNKFATYPKPPDSAGYA